MELNSVKGIGGRTAVRPYWEGYEIQFDSINFRSINFKSIQSNATHKNNATKIEIVGLDSLELPLGVGLVGGVAGDLSGDGGGDGPSIPE